MDSEKYQQKIDEITKRWEGFNSPVENSKNNLREEYQQKVDEIAKRWTDMPTKPYCHDYMYEAIRHCDRNVDMDMLCRCEYNRKTECYYNEDLTDKDVIHPERHDGGIFAHSSADIHILLDIINSLLANKK